MPKEIAQNRFDNLRFGSNSAQKLYFEMQKVNYCPFFDFHIFPAFYESRKIRLFRSFVTLFHFLRAKLYIREQMLYGNIICHTKFCGKIIKLKNGQKLTFWISKYTTSMQHLSQIGGGFHALFSGLAYFCQSWRNWKS